MQRWRLLFVGIAASMLAAIAIGPASGLSIGSGLPIVEQLNTRSAPASSGPSLDASRLTRVRIRLETTSDWARFEVTGVSFAYRRVIATSPGASVGNEGAGMHLRGPSPAWAEILGVLDVPVDAQPLAVLNKGWVGTARGIVIRSLADEVTVADVVSTRHSSDNTVTAAVGRSVLVGPGLTTPKIDPRPLVMAFYYPWFTDESFQHGSWWDKPSGPADNFNPAEVRAMVDQAANAGIDGFVVSWQGYRDVTKGYELVRQIAAARGNFYIAPLIELTHAGLASDPARVEDLIRQTAARASQPESLTKDGRPVVFLYGTKEMDPADWAGVRSRLLSSGIDPFVVADTFDGRYGAQGSYMYNPAGFGAEHLRGEYLTRARDARLRQFVFPGARQTLWAATVSPGMYDSPSGMLDGTREPRNNGGRYEETWVAALNSRPEWVLVTSWNEWIEETHIQPGTRTGTTALSQTGAWSARFTP